MADNLCKRSLQAIRACGYEATIAGFWRCNNNGVGKHPRRVIGWLPYANEMIYSAPRKAYRRRKRTERIQMRGLISRYRPVPTLIKVKESIPRLRPVAMLKVSGVATRVRKAG